MKSGTKKEVRRALHKETVHPQTAFLRLCRGRQESFRPADGGEHPRRLTLSLAAIGFAPLSAGRYRCLVCDAKGQTELFDMSESGGSVKKDSALDISEGLACLVCFAGGRVTPVAFGKCGDRVYDVKKLCALVDGTENPAKDAGGKTEETSAGKRGAKNLPAPAAQGAEGAEQGTALRRRGGGDAELLRFFGGRT